MIEEQKYAPGTILEDQKTKSYWLVLQPMKIGNKMNMIANLFNGEVKHLNWLEEPKEISCLEVMW
jgi:hypothetical protein